MNTSHLRADADIASLAPPTETATVASIIDGYKNYQALRAGYRSGLFDWLQQQSEGVERSAIADALNLRGAHLGAFLQSLQDLGLLKREGTRYQLATGMERVLCADSMWCQAEAVSDLEATDNGWADLQRFMGQDWTQRGDSTATPERAPFLGEVRRLIDCLTHRKDFSHALANAQSLVCFDGSGGLLGAALGQRFSHLDITIVVPEGQLADTAVRLRELGFLNTEKRSIVTGTLLDLPAAMPTFDYAIVFHSLYPVRKSTDTALGALSALLDPGAEACLAHWFCLEACETAPGGLRDLDKAVLTDSHPLCGIERFGQRLQQAGLDFIERLDAPGEYGNTKLHFARKPSA